MKDQLLKNFEKVILTSLLVVLAGCAVFLILTMDRTEIKVINNPNAGVMVEEANLSSLPEISIKLVEDKIQPYDPRGYIYCRKSDCNYLILSSLPKCPWCKTDTKPEVVIVQGTGDKDNDGISDQEEIKLGLNPEDPNDVHLDKDEDGFMNIDEYKADTDIADKNSHPSIIKRSKLHPRIRKTDYYPILFSYFTKLDEKDKKTWDIYGDIVNSRGRRVKSIFKRVNDKIDEIGYVISDVGSEDGKDFIVIEKEGEDPVKIFASKKMTPKKTVYIIVNELTDKILTVELGKEFKLTDKSGNEERYKAESIDLQNRKLIIIDYQTSEKVELGLETILKAEKATTTEVGPELEGIPLEFRE